MLRTRVFGVLAVLAGLVAAPLLLGAHEVPARVVVQTFVYADAARVRVLVRVPMAAMRDVEFPLRGAEGYLDIARADSHLQDAARIWVADAVTILANGNVLPLHRIVSVRAALPSDRSFASYDSALKSVTGPPLPAGTDIVASQAMLDVLLEYAAAPPAARLAIQSKFGHLGVKTTMIVRASRLNGPERAFAYEGDQPLLQLNPSWWNAAGRFVAMGFRHLVDGLDHILFLICLVLPVRRLRPLIGIITAFTVAHSITLVASVAGYAPDALWFPPLVELCIAASIVYTAIENIVGAKLERRWMVAFGFGLVHGFGFSYALRESLQFAGDHLAMALAAFNIGIELGQLCILAIAVPAFSWLFSRVLAERAGILICSVMVAHTAWHWMTERFAVLRTYRVSLPAFDNSLALTAVRFALVLVVAAVAARLLTGFMTRLSSARSHIASVLVFGAVSATLVVMGLGPRALMAQPSAQARSTKGGVYTADQAVKGKEVFAGNCSGCHTVASHSGTAFSERWMGRSLLEFYGYVSRLMPKSTPGALSEDEYVWVTAYVLRLNGMPAGTRELSAEPALLKSIRIDSTVVGAKSTSGATFY